MSSNNVEPAYCRQRFSWDAPPRLTRRCWALGKRTLAGRRKREREREWEERASGINGNWIQTEQAYLFWYRPSHLSGSTCHRIWTSGAVVASAWHPSADFVCRTCVCWEPGSLDRTWRRPLQNALLRLCARAQSVCVQSFGLTGLKLPHPHALLPCMQTKVRKVDQIGSDRTRRDQISAGLVLN